jgi:hypothetical protein
MKNENLGTGFIMFMFIISIIIIIFQEFHAPTHGERNLFPHLLPFCASFLPRKLSGVFLC